MSDGIVYSVELNNNNLNTANNEYNTSSEKKSEIKNLCDAMNKAVEERAGKPSSTMPLFENSKLSFSNRYKTDKCIYIVSNRDLTVVAYIVRWLGSVASGVIFYADYAAEAGYDNALVYSMVYNGSFLLVDLAILAVVLVALYMVIPSSEKDNTIATVQKFTAEFIGTFTLVFLGCGTAMAVGCDSVNGGGYILTAFAFGLVIVVWW